MNNEKIINDKLKKVLGKSELSVKLTWRFGFYIMYLIIVIFLVTNSLLTHYENKMFAGFVFLLFIMSYPFSIFLIKREEVY